MAQIGGATPWTDSVYQLAMLIPVDSELQKASNRCHWKGYEVSFPGICGASKTESIYVLDARFTSERSYRPSQTRTRIGLSLQLDLDALVAPLLLHVVRQQVPQHHQGS